MRVLGPAHEERVVPVEDELPALMRPGDDGQFEFHERFSQLPLKERPRPPTLSRMRSANFNYLYGISTVGDAIDSLHSRRSLGVVPKTTAPPMQGVGINTKVVRGASGMVPPPFELGTCFRVEVINAFALRGCEELGEPGA